jgi:PAS domain S-box-containing protein
VIIIGAAAILANASVAGYDAWRSYRDALDDTNRELVNTARVLSAQTAGTLEAIDVLLRDTASWYEDEGSHGPVDVLAQLTSRPEVLPWLLGLSIADADGMQYYRSKEAKPFGVDISDRSYFKAQRDEPHAGLFVSEPIHERSADGDALAFSRRLTDREGRFAGVVSGYIALDTIQGFYRQVDVGSHSAVVLLRDDGTLLFRQPSIPNTVGRAFPLLVMLSPDAAMRIASPLDGIRRFIAMARVGGYPMVVNVARDESSVLAPLREQAVAVLIRTLILSGLGVIVVAALVRQLRRGELGEEALCASAERYALAMDATNEGHFDVRLDGGPSFYSERMAESFGANNSVIESDRDSALRLEQFHPDDREAVRAAFEAHIEGRTPRFEIERRVRRPDGQWRWAHVRARVTRDNAGRATRLVGAVADVTDRKKAEAEKDRLEARLRKAQRMEAVGTLAGGIAHDFNNILGAIIGYGEMAQKAAAPGSELRRYLDNVMHAGARAKSLVERILVFSRGGASDRSPVQVQAVVEETLALLSASLPAKVRLEHQLEARGVAVFGDATRLHQMVMNLCTNALQAMPDGGVLSVRLDTVNTSESRSLSLGELRPGSYVRLEVRDTGTGIEPEVLDRMFDPFFTTKRAGGGTGLGLSLVHGIVSDWGCTIDVSSEVGRGTRFAIWLPALAAIPGPTTDIADELPHGEGQVVMVVDDEPALVALAEETLAELGYEPVGYRSGRAALEAFAADPKRFDLVLTDEMMPEITGTGLAQTFKRLRPEIPIILMTGYTDSGAIALARSAGIATILRKPLQIRDIAESVARLIPSSISDVHA